MIRHRLSATLLAALLAAGGAPAFAAEEDSPPPHVLAELPDARLTGTGGFRWFGLKLYDAWLWVGGRRADVPDAAPLALQLRYARELKGRRIAQASADEIERMGIGSAQQRAAWLARMTALFPDVKEGTRITGVHVPGRGVRFYLDGQALGDIWDAEFGPAFFAIWLGPGTSAPELRRALLRNLEPQR